MTDHPASWLSDPTGRHDHRYWDGTQWTDHVADAGVAASDPYDGPADATPEAAGVETPAAETTATSASGWATTPTEEAEPAAAADPVAPSPSGWGASTEPAAEPSATEPAPAETVSDEPAPSDLFAPPVSGWGASATPDAGDAATAAAEPPATETPSPWSAPSTSDADSGVSDTGVSDTGVSDTGTAEGDTADALGAAAVTEPAVAEGVGDEAPTEVTESTTARWGAAPTGPSPTWGDPHTATTPPVVPTPTPGPADEGDGSGQGRSRKGLLVALALLAIVAIVVALVLVGDDDDVGDDEAAGYAKDIAEQLQEQGPVSDEDAECVGEYVVDEIGASRLKGVNLRADTAPPELADDFQSAIQDAFTECDVSLRSGEESSDTDGAGDEATTGATDSSAIGAMTEQQYADYYASALGLSPEKAACLAERSADAVASGETSEDASSEAFYEWLSECGISVQEIQQGAQNADPATGTG